MKTLLLIRHAKSGWGNASLSDFERTLDEKGKSDATMMAKKLIAKSLVIDAFVSSSAIRALQTATIFMDEYKAGEERLLLVPSLYEAPVKTFYNVINSLDDRDNTVALFAHNPGITDFANSLECSPVDNMPTCAICGLIIRTGYWKGFTNAEKEFLFFEYPKSAS